MPRLVVRSSLALTSVTVIAVVAMFAVAGGMSRSGRSSTRASVRVAGYSGPSTADHQLTALLRGVVVAVPVFIVFAMLLAAADDVFASVLLLGELLDLVVAGWRADRSWFPGVAFVAGIGLVVGLNQAQLGRGDDAVATLVSRPSQLDVRDLSVLTTELCRRAERETSLVPFEYKRSSVRAEQVLDGLCDGRNR